MTNYDKLIKKLAELFMLDQADLDFGIYRIMNAKRDEINRFLERDLLPQVRQILSEHQTAEQAQMRQELDEAVGQAQNLGVDPDSVAKVQELRQKLAVYDIEALEEEVFSYLHTFFSRYYKDGDFVSQRRYKEDIYAIPYEGEEVKLYWANHDQYYIKSSERFRDYTFKLPDERRVHFKLVDAGTEQNNNKAANGNDRRFILCEETPLVEQDGELFLRFEYRPDPDKRKQATHNEMAIETILAQEEVSAWDNALRALQPTKANPNRTLLQKHLRDYTARNSFDYFIHKNLGKFLRRELDFFIKNEVMHLDDIENLSAPRAEQYLGKILALRKIAGKIIAFLAQIEDFQKKLWLKKKFVIETNYCITLDRVPEELYSEIAANDAQREEWVRLFAIDKLEGDLHSPGYSEPLKIEFLRSHHTLLLDTRFFSQLFKDRVLRDISIEGDLDGMLVHGENQQALALLDARYMGAVPCMYIDPPYNRDGDDFIYKDNYRHSTWMSMLHDRLVAARRILTDAGVMMISIDRNEMHRLVQVGDNVFGEHNRVAEFIWEKGRKNDSKHVSLTHEYFVVYARDYECLKQTCPKWREAKDGVPETMDEFHRLRKKHGDDFGSIRDALSLFVIRKVDPLAARSILLFSKTDEHGLFRDDTDISWPKPGGPRYDIVNPETGDVADIPPNGWRWTQETGLRMLADGELDFDPDNPKRLRKKRYLHEYDDQVKSTVVYKHSKAATRQLRDVMGADVFPNPKDADLIATLIDYVSSNDATVCDFFAGSGVTAHAAVLLNRKDEGRRRYLLVEMGDYFDSVLKPRVQRIVYSDQWKGGLPVSRNGVSHAFKYIHLESYEDVLTNLELKRGDQQRSLLEKEKEFRENYLLSYMLDVETHGSQSLLRFDAFRNPMGYTLNVQHGDEIKEVNVDVMETFNWLLGLRVRHINMPQHLDAAFKRSEERATEDQLVVDGRLRPSEDGTYWFRTIEGTSPENDKVLVIWRNLTDNPEEHNLVLDEWFRKQEYSTRDLEFDVIYVNGDNNLENLRREDETWKVRLIEEDFQRLMFDVQDV